MPTTTQPVTQYKFTFGGADKNVDVMDAAAGADPELPMVILLHGLKGNARNMTAPDYNYNHNAAVPFEIDRGWHMYPNWGIWSVEVDPFMPVTSWQTALHAAGFPTLVYDQIDSDGFLARPTLELQALIAQVLVLPKFVGKKLAFTGHSRGGLLLRNYLVASKGELSLLNRIVAAVTLHSPNEGSQLANNAISLDAAITGIRTALRGIGIPPIAFLDWLQNQVKSDAFQELSVGSPFLAALAPNEPVPGIRYHTFGGTGTRVARVRSNAFSPISSSPQAHWPPFHWTTFSVQLFSLLDAMALLAPSTALALLPELQPGAGDVLVADARAHLPFSASRHTNALNHMEALFDPALQKQVINILRGSVGKPPLP